MPRAPRIDATDVLHHVRARGIGRKKIFLSDGDREDFLSRLEKTCELHEARVYAWCLMPNHFHLAIRTGIMPLSKTMSSVLTGYAMGFNHRNKHDGHLFQNRYKSTVVDEEQYFLALVRYIHLNPVRARMIDSVEALTDYPWAGHCVLMGRSKRSFQDVDAVLRLFGKRAGAARKELVAFMKMDQARSEEKVFKGGGLRRSMGAKSQSARGNKEKWAHDERILGDSSFVESVLKKNDRENRYTILSPDEKWKAFDNVLKRLCEEFDVTPRELFGGSKRRPVSEVRQLLSYAGSRALGISAAELSRSLNVSSQAILKAAAKAEETWEELTWVVEGIKK
jgi:putative transposase